MSHPSSQPRRRIINATAPIRICDLGGWTDTWFAGSGAVLNLAVYPPAEVQILVRSGEPGEHRIIIHAENYGERYALEPHRPAPGRHPLLEACIDILDLGSRSFEVNLYCAAPGGCSTGTSAAITVALLGALDLLAEGRRSPHEIAALAHRVETEKLGLQCGIQDQLCSAYGGICFLEMFHYPQASLSQLRLPDTLWWELERRLVLVFLGRTHSSSAVHEQVIAHLEQPGADKSILAPLRRAARAGKEALYRGDLDAFGRAMIANTEAQAALHPALLSADARAVIDLARHRGAAGWKLNGAGGEGGSLTILASARGEERRAFEREVEGLGRGFRVIPTYLARIGLRRWEMPFEPPRLSSRGASPDPHCPPRE